MSASDLRGGGTTSAAFVDEKTWSSGTSSLPMPLSGAGESFLAAPYVFLTAGAFLTAGCFAVAWERAGACSALASEFPRVRVRLCGGSISSSVILALDCSSSVASALAVREMVLPERETFAGRVEVVEDLPGDDMLAMRILRDYGHAECASQLGLEQAGRLDEGRSERASDAGK